MGSEAYAGDQARYAGHQVQNLNNILENKFLEELKMLREQIEINNALLMLQNNIITSEQYDSMTNENKKTR